MLWSAILRAELSSAYLYVYRGLHAYAIIGNAENPVSLDAPKRRSPLLQAAAAVSLFALTAVIAVTSSRFGSDRDIEAVTETGTEAAIVNETGSR